MAKSGRKRIYVPGYEFPLGGSVVSRDGNALTIRCADCNRVAERTYAAVTRAVGELAPVVCATCAHLRKVRPLNPSDQSREIVRLRNEERLTLQKIAERFGISRERVRQVLERHDPSYRGRADDVDRKDQRIHLPGKTIGGLKILSREGYEIELLCKCGQRYSRDLRAVIGKAGRGEPLRCRQCYRIATRRLDDTALLADYDAGLPWKEICRRNNCSIRMVTVVLRRNGRIAKRSKGKSWDWSDVRRFRVISGQEATP